MIKWYDLLTPIFFLLFSVARLDAQEFNHSVKSDGIEALGLMKDASYLQFTETKTLIAAGSLVAGMLLFHQEDKTLRR